MTDIHCKKHSCVFQHCDYYDSHGTHCVDDSKKEKVPEGGMIPDIVVWCSDTNCSMWGYCDPDEEDGCGHEVEAYIDPTFYSLADFHFVVGEIPRKDVCYEMMERE